ncbi:MAG TPA: hypothetical protein EYQ25_00035, partial [Planctomycetes bacterium]|nr:hypothetical protein [Planctomycetota bacterium]
MFELEIELWDSLTKLEPRRRAGALALRLKGKPQRIALKAMKTHRQAMLQPDGLKLLMATIKSGYVAENMTEQFQIALNLWKMLRGGGKTIPDHIMDWESLKDEATANEFTASPKLEGAMLLHSANLTDDHKLLVMTALQGQTVDDVKAALLKVFPRKASRKHLLTTGPDAEGKGKGKQQKGKGKGKGSHAYEAYGQEDYDASAPPVPEEGEVWETKAQQQQQEEEHPYEEWEDEEGVCWFVNKKGNWKKKGKGKGKG